MTSCSKFFLVTFIVFLCTAVFVENREAGTTPNESKEKVIESCDYLKEVLPKIANVTKYLKEKHFYVQVPTVPSNSDVARCGKIVDAHLWFIRDTDHVLDFSSPVNQPTLLFRKVPLQWNEVSS